MTKKTTIKPMALAFRPVGSLASVEYTTVMGVSNDMALNQDKPDTTDVKGEFYASPFATIYDNKPAVLSYTLVNYALADLPSILGGTYTAATASDPEKYTPADNAAPIELEWKITYQQGNNGVIIYRGATSAALTGANKAALGYAITITALTPEGGTGMYSIIGDPKTGA